MFFLQFVPYLSSFVVTLKKEIPEAALELCQLKIKQCSPGILKFSKRHEDNPFTFNYSMVPHFFCLYFMQVRIDWVLRIFGTQVTKKKRPVRPVFSGYLSVFYDYGPMYQISQWYFSSVDTKWSDLHEIRFHLSISF